jgi:L-ornithine Nalpha-acyltransferase
MAEESMLYDPKTLSDPISVMARKGSGIMHALFHRPVDDGLTLGRMGTLEVRLAATKKDIKRAQRLRYEVFFEEMSAIPDLVSRMKRRDIDSYDAICDHLLVIDHGTGPKPKIVGTYRLLRKEIADRHGGFYSANEFDIAPMLQAHGNKRFLELGRSCVAKVYRDKRTVELLWHGIWSYVKRHRIDVLFGCASFPGTDPQRLAIPLSYLHHTAATSEREWTISALPHRKTDMNLMPPDAINPKIALKAMPPLVKAYLRLGAKIGQGAVIDHQFGTTDVLVILPVSDINPRYIDHYGEEAERYAA